MFLIANLLLSNLIVSEHDDVADDDVDGIAQARITIQFGDLMSNRHFAHYLVKTMMCATVQMCFR